ncbi:putative baseplate assembly protein [Sorangium sp. So ce1024]|uniref:putative baseplate assembly protein n=1 Tax=unclassified Sorangium TaxID=2621164 RepID=UPI003F023794
MPIQPPRLDDRAYDDLVAELIARIPAHTPEWTHAAPGDPGRTLLELFAWLGDALLYRANLVPERQRLVFLKLLGVPLRSALPARGIVSVHFDGDAPRPPAPLRAGAELGGPVPFETTGEVTVLPLSAVAYGKRALTDAEARQMAPIVEELRALYRLPGRALPYVTTPAFPEDRLRPEGFDVIADTADGCLWLALLAPKASAVAATRDELARGPDGRPHVLNVGVVPALSLPATLDELPERRRIAHVWEMTTDEAIQGEPVYRALDVLHDGTDGLNRQGVVRLVLPGAGIGAPTNDVRAAIDAGVGPRPPRLDDPQLADRLVAWLRLRPTERLESLRIGHVSINAVEIDQRRTVRDRVVAQSSGAPDQAIQLSATSIEEETLVLEVAEPGQPFVPWQRVGDLATQGRDAAAFTLDPEAGVVRFGDGARGRVPAAGARVRVARMRSGGGAQGNLPPGSLKAITAWDPAGARVNNLKVVQRAPTAGGVAAETLAEAEARIPALLRHRERAVTEEDFRALAATTPGLHLGRVEVLPRFKPHQRRSGVPGAVSVMVLPLKAARQPPNPRPDRPFLEAVFGWLDPRRVLGTELYVIGPEYVGLALTVGVSLREGFGREEGLAAVRDALRAWLWPLPPGGAAGLGWPLGGAVSTLELAVAVARVPAVAAVRGVRLFLREGDRFRRASAGGAQPESVQLLAWQLPELLAVVAVEGDPPDDLREPAGGEGGIPIPVVPEVC